MTAEASAVTAPRPQAPVWLALAALGALWAVFIRELGPQWSAFQEYNYGWSVPALAVVLLWRRWRTRPAPVAPVFTPGMSATVICLTLVLFPARLILEANPVWRLFDWLTALAVTGITLAGIYYAGGIRYLRHFCFPVLFVLVAVPWPSSLEIAMVQGLTRMNVRATATVLNAAGFPALPHGNDIETANGLVGIDEGCSGIRSLQTTLMLSLFLGEAYRLGRAARGVMVLAGIAFALLCNLARTVLLAAICARSGPGATGQWHDLTGVTLLLLCFSGQWLTAAWLSGKRPSPIARTTGDVANAFGRLPPAWCFVTLVAWLVSSAVVTETWYRAHESDGQTGRAWTVKWPVGRRDYHEAPIDQWTRSVLQYDEGKSARWAGDGSAQWQCFYFRWLPTTSARGRVEILHADTHRPEICLPATGMTLRRDFGIVEFKVGSTPLSFTKYEFEDHGLPLHVYRCVLLERNNELISGDEMDNRQARFEAVRIGHRRLGQRLLEIAVWGIPDNHAADLAIQGQFREIIVDDIRQ